MPDKAAYRKFKMRLLGNNDFGHLEEVIRRRFHDKNRREWGLPDLFLIDGGKGQLEAAIKARNETEYRTPMISLAKREEEIIVQLDESMVHLDPEVLRKHQAIIKTSDHFTTILLPTNSDIVKLLQRIRDESHRFAVSYHSVLKGKRQTASALDLIPGVGPSTRKKLLRAFGSKQGIQDADIATVAEVVGRAKAMVIKQHLG
jgi:excinuclease ABC subunit C